MTYKFNDNTIAKLVSNNRLIFVHSNPNNNTILWASLDILIESYSEQKDYLDQIVINSSNNIIVFSIRYLGDKVKLSNAKNEIIFDKTEFINCLKQYNN